MSPHELPLPGEVPSSEPFTPMLDEFEQAPPPTANASWMPGPIAKSLDFWRMTGSDRERGGRLTSLSIGAMVTGLAVEWCGFNEWALGSTASHTLQHTGNIYETGAATGSVSLLIQTTVGLTAAWALNRCPDAIDKVREWLSSREKRKEDSALTTNAEALSKADSPLHTGSNIELTLEVPESKERSRLSQVAANIGRTAVQKTSSTSKVIGRTIGRPLIVGSAINLIMEAQKGEKETYLHNTAKILGWSAIVGAGVDVMSTGGAQLLIEGKEHGFESLAHLVVSDILPNPLTYLAIAGAVYAVSRGVKTIKNKLPAILERVKAKHLGPGRHVRGRKAESSSQDPVQPPDS